MSTSSTESSSSRSRVTGLASGFDTQSIVESLMSLEKMPFKKLEVKKQTEDVKLQAYQAVNTYLLKFRTAMNAMASKKLWNSNATVSTNEKSITANANEYAVKGTYNFRVAQLATATQYMTKGFSSKDATLVKDIGADTAAAKTPLGSIRVASAKTRVDNSAKLDTLNGGKGVYRGSIRLTDAAGNSSIVDLSACDTLEDVTRALNESTGAQVSSYIDEKGRLCIEDASNGAGSVRVQNVGSATTANDLGIAGTSSATGSGGNALLVGENAYTLGNEMSLSLLNDGLGVEPGNIQFTISDTSGNTRAFYVNIDDCETVGDLTKRVNDAIEAERKRDDADQPLKKDQLADLRFTLSDDKTGFALVGTQANMTYAIGDRDGSNQQGKGSPAADLGLTGRYTTTSAAEDLAFGRVLGSANSPMLKSLTGVGGNGVGASADPNSENGKVTLPFTEDTLLSTLNKGRGLDLSTQFQIRVREGGQENRDATTYTDIVSAADLEGFMSGGDKTVGELLTFLNGKLDAYAKDPANNAAALNGMSFEYNADHKAIAITGAQVGYSYEIVGSVPASIGVTRFSDDGSVYVGLYPGDTNTNDAAVQDAVNEFYGVTGASSLLTENNAAIDENTVLGDMLKLAGIDKAAYTDPAIDLADYTDIPDGKTAQEQYDEALHASWVAASTAELNTMFSSGGDFTLSAGDGAGAMQDFTVSWADVAAKLGGTIDENTNVNDFIDAMNTAIADAFAGQVDPNGDPFLAPKVSVNRYDNGFAWSNVDMSREWVMDGGATFANMNLNKDTADISIAHTGAAVLNSGSLTMAGDIAQPLPPMAQGYFVVEDLEGSTPLSQLNLTQGLTFRSGEFITIGMSGPGGDTVINLSTDDIRAQLAALPNPDDATVDDYLGILNNLVSTALGAPAAGDPSFEFGIVDGGIGLKNLQNIDKISVGGDAVSGILYQGIQVHDAGFRPISNFEVTAGEDVALGELIPVSYHPNPIGGVGQLEFSIGSDATTYRLNTDGITQSSSLNELVAKLNSELERLAADPAGNPDLANVRFTLNENGTGIAVDNGMSKAIVFHDTKDSVGNSDNQFLGQDLGLVNQDGSSRRVEARTFDNMDTLNRQIISRATSLKQLLGDNHTMGTIRLTDATGQTQNIGLENVKTVGDMIDAINLYYPSGFGMRAQINAKGDGIEIIQEWAPGYQPPADKLTATMKIEDVENGTTAKKLGIAGAAQKDDATGATKIDGSTSINIEVMPDDTLTTLMHRIAESGAYKCAIINSGTASNPVYRLSVASATTGEATDFVISCDVEALGFGQTSRGRDAKVLYGDPSSNSSPILLSSATNSNSTAILGLTLDLKSTSSEWSSITVDTDKEKVVENIKTMVTAYNDLVGLIMKLDGYDEETGEKGILFGDNNVRSMMDTINEFFYQVYNPGNYKYGDKTDDGKQAIWSWMDAGITLSSRNSNSDGSGAWFTTLELDEEALQNMVSDNWDVLSAMMASEQNVADPSRPESARPSASFNGELEGPAGNAINGNASKSSTNGIVAKDTIENGANTYTIVFKQPTTLSRMSIYHPSAETALRDYVIEYMDPATGDWKVHRTIEGKETDQEHIGFPDMPTASAVRIRASSTNAEDGKFRLLDVQIYEQSGLASKLNQSVDRLSDVTNGFLASRTEEHNSTIADLTEQMDRLQSVLDAKEEALWRKFTAMETALGKLQNQGSYFDTMMGSMNK